MRKRRKPDFELEASLWDAGFQQVAGVDEAGRGPLAGPVVAAAVILPRDWPREIVLDDSKRMTAAARETAFVEIRRRATAWRIAVVSHEEIDRINILRATLAGMARAVAGLKGRADCVLVDGNQAPPVTVPCRTIVGGDGLSLSVAAASVLAKVVRDRLMRVYDRRDPGWGFAAHKGYPTAAHRAALERLGWSPIHRRTFGAVGREMGSELARSADRPAGEDGEGRCPEAPEAGTSSGGFPASLTTRAGWARSTQPDFWSGEAAPSASATGAAPKARST
jgi:ribonuclease HII